MPRRDLGYSQASQPNCSTDAECRQCRESNPEPRRLRRSFSSPDPCLVRRILTGLGQPTSDAVAGDVPTTCGRLPRGFHRRVGVTGFEPATFRPQTGCATKLRHTPMLPSHVLASARPGFARRTIGSRRRLPGFACQCAAGCPVGSGAVLTAHAPITGVSGGGRRAPRSVHCSVVKCRCRRSSRGRSLRRDGRTRTCNVRLWRPLFSQLNYIPMFSCPSCVRPLLRHPRRPCSPWTTRSGHTRSRLPEGSGGGSCPCASCA